VVRTSCRAGPRSEVLLATERRAPRLDLLHCSPRPGDAQDCAEAVTILVARSILVHYEALRLCSAVIPELGWVKPRGRVVLMVLACFAAHTIEVWLFAIAYYLFVDVLHLGGFGGLHQDTFVDNVSFSAITYSSLDSAMCTRSPTCG
jgi:hypothetical protein